MLSSPGVKVLRPKTACTTLNATHILRLNTFDVSNASQEAVLNIEVQQFWDLDSIGNRDTITVEEQFERKIIF